MSHLDEGTLQAWLDGPRSGLSSDELASIADHVEQCAECAGRVAELRSSTERTLSLLDTAGSAAAPSFADIQARRESLDAETASGAAESGVGESGVGESGVGGSGAGAPASRTGTGSGVGSAGRPSPAPRQPLVRRWKATRWAASIAIALGAGWAANDLYRRPAARGLPEAATLQEAPAIARERAAPETAAAEAETGDGARVGGDAAGGDAPSSDAASGNAAGGTTASGTTASAPGTQPFADLPPTVLPPEVEAALPAAEAEPTPSSPAGSSVGLAERAAPTPPPAVVPDDAGTTAAAGARTAERAEAAAALPPSEEADRADVAGELQEARIAPFDIRGKVVAAGSDSPLQGVQVYVPAVDRGALTDAAGNYRITLDPATLARAGVQTDTLTVFAQRIGFGEQARALTGGSDQVRNLDFELEATALALDALVVTGVVEGDTVRRQARASMSVPGAPASTLWFSLPFDDVERTVGFAPWFVPGLAIASTALLDRGNRTYVRVIQSLDGGGELTLIQVRDAPPTDELGARRGEFEALGRMPPRPVPDGESSTLIQVGDLAVWASAPRTLVDLEGLLERLR